MSYPSTRWYQTSATLGGQPTAQVESSPKHNVGQRIRAKDYTYGEAEFIYLPGVASCAAGSLAVFDEKAGTTALALKGMRGQLAVAMAAITAGLYGWWAVDGSVPVLAEGAGQRVGPGYLCATAGAVSDVDSEGERVDGLTIRAPPSGGFVTCRLTGPSANGNDSNAREEKG